MIELDIEFLEPVDDAAAIDVAIVEQASAFASTGVEGEREARAQDEIIETEKESGAGEDAASYSEDESDSEWEDEMDSDEYSEGDSIDWEAGSFDSVPPLADSPTSGS